MTRLLRLAFWAAAAFAFVMAVLPQPPQLPGAPPDKVQHMLAFAVLTGLVSAGWPRTAPLRILLGLSGFGLLIELVQAIPALHRSADWRDWLADTAAILVILALAALLRRFRPDLRPPPPLIITCNKPRAALGARRLTRGIHAHPGSFAVRRLFARARRARPGAAAPR